MGAHIYRGLCSVSGVILVSTLLTARSSAQTPGALYVPQVVRDVSSTDLPPGTAICDKNGGALGAIAFSDSQFATVATTNENLRFPLSAFHHHGHCISLQADSGEIKNMLRAVRQGVASKP